MITVIIFPRFMRPVKLSPTKTAMEAGEKVEQIHPRREKRRPRVSMQAPGGVADRGGWV